MTTFLLDTNVFAALAQPLPSRKIVRAFEKNEGSLVTAALVMHEMWFGIFRLPPSKKRDHLEKFMNDVVGTIQVLPYGGRAARWHAAERARLTAVGRPPPFLDGQIAAVAAVHNATVITANVVHFQPFERLRVENWSA